MGEGESILKVAGCWWLDQEINLSRTSSSKLTRKSTSGGSSTCQGPSQRPQALAQVRGAASTYLFIVPSTTPLGWECGMDSMDPVTYKLHHCPAALTTWYLV